MTPARWPTIDCSKDLTLNEDAELAHCQGKKGRVKDGIGRHVIP